MEITNGESIIGYQYLHGTDMNAGGFNISGTITKLQNGEIQYFLCCTWNDYIDPNDNYKSDRVKADIANFLFNPTDYVISISWVYTNYDFCAYCPPAGRAPRDTYSRLN